MHRQDLSAALTLMPRGRNWLAYCFGLGIIVFAYGARPFFSVPYLGAKKLKINKLALFPDLAPTLEFNPASAAEILRSNGIDSQTCPLLEVWIQKSRSK